MATTPRISANRQVEYPTSDGKPMAETDAHRQNLTDLIETLQLRFAADPMVYVSGNLLVFYEQGNRRKHVAPDVFLVRGAPKLPLREHYLVWQEGKSLDVVIELTSKTTRAEDQGKKLELYRTVLKVSEYFLFDPYGDWLEPSLQGYRLTAKRYAAIKPVAGRLPSEILGLQLGREGLQLRLFEPASGLRLPTPREQAEGADAARQLAEAGRLRAEAAQFRAEAAQIQAEVARSRLEAENERLRRELEELRRRLPGDPSSS